jgi:5-phospho-D-xylono-1,4-lactonase
VLGPRPAESLSVVDAHAHMWISGAPPGSPQLADEDLSLRELRDLRAAGGEALVDCQPGGCGRDGEVLRRLMQESGVAIVASTGFHMRRHYGPETGPWADPAGALDAFTRELNDGLSEAPRARAGVVKCAWTGADAGAERELMAAALEAARATGAALVVHTERGHAVEELVAVVAQAGVNPAAVQLSHVDKRPDPILHSELARAGFVLGYDTFLRPKHDPERRVWPLLRSMVGAGLWESVTLGTDLVDHSAWRSGGGPGLRGLPRGVLGQLRREDVGEEVLAALAGGNALRLLARRAEVPA